MSARFKFSPGQVVFTPGAGKALTRNEIFFALHRHLRGDWGDLEDEDKQTNDRAVADGGRLLSAYKSWSGTKFWVITEADRATTTFLLPDEY